MGRLLTLLRRLAAGGDPVPTVPQTLDPDSVGTRVTVSGGGLIASSNATSPDSAMGTRARQHGKVFFQVTYTAIVGAVGVVPGFDGGFNDNARLGTSGHGLGIDMAGTVTLQGNVIGNWAGAGVGDVIGIAVDFDHHAGWVIKNGVVQGGGNPAAGTVPTFLLPEDFTDVDVMFPGVTVAGNGSRADVNFGASPYVNPAPVGFGLW